jgi:hypothetical protein
MFARAVEHARRNKRATVTLSDVNVAIGEFGQGKMDELSQDARNSEGELRDMLTALEAYCLDDHETNGFLLASEESKERRLVQILSDVRLVHLINQSITPDRPGQRYAAYILDYSLFTGFRRRQNIEEMVPEEGQFRAQELRRLPKVNPGFLESHLVACSGERETAGWRYQISKCFLRRCPESTHQVNDSCYLVGYGDDESGDSMSRADDTVIAFLMFCLEIYQREQERKRKLH